jgi:hypothetical protein
MVEKEQMYTVEETGVRIFKNAYTDRINEAMHRLHALRAEEAKINGSISYITEKCKDEFRKFIGSAKIGDEVQILSTDKTVTTGVVVDKGWEEIDPYLTITTEHGFTRITLDVVIGVEWAAMKKGDE